ncbi:MAG: hypothetical protein ACLT3H_10110 [Roseburia sp.]
MKKTKQILALIGVTLLLGMYLATLICALSDSKNFMNLLMASIYATVVVPALIWGYTFICHLVKKDKPDDRS